MNIEKENYTSEEIIDKFKDCKTSDDIMLILKSLTDEQIKEIVGDNYALTDDENRIIIFPDEFQAITYGSEMQRQHPEIRFIKIHKHFSILMPRDGIFYTIEPISTEKSQTEGFDYESGDDFVFANPYTAYAIYEKCRREKEKPEEVTVTDETVIK